MKFLDISKLTNSLPVADQKESRRGILRKIVSGSAALATGFFVSNRAQANHDACDCAHECGIDGNNCWWPVGLCWDEDEQQYWYKYDIYFGTPPFSCCAITSGIHCVDVCSSSPLSC